MMCSFKARRRKAGEQRQGRGKGGRMMGLLTGEVNVTEARTMIDTNRTSTILKQPKKLASAE